MEGITMAQEWKKEDDASRPLISLGSALPEHPPVPELMGADG